MANADGQAVDGSPTGSHTIYEEHDDDDDKTKYDRHDQLASYIGWLKAC